MVVSVHSGIVNSSHIHHYVTLVQLLLLPCAHYPVCVYALHTRRATIQVTLYHTPVMLSQQYFTAGNFTTHQLC